MDRQIQPGKSDKIEVVIAAPPRGQMLTKRISAQTNDRQNTNIFLECAGQVHSALTLNPPTVNFGQIKRDSQGETQTVKLKRGDGGPLKPVVKASSNPQISAELHEVQPGEEYELQVAIKPPWPATPVYGNLTIDTGVEQAAQELVSVFASVMPRLQALPPTFYYQPQPEGKDYDATVKLHWGGEPGKVLDVSVTDPQLKAEYVDDPNQPAIRLHFPADYKPKMPGGSLVTVKTDDKVMPQLNIAVQSFARPLAARPPTVAGPVMGPPYLPPAAVEQRAPGAPPAFRPVMPSPPAGAAPAAQPGTMAQPSAAPGSPAQPVGAGHPAAPAATQPAGAAAPQVPAAAR